MIKQKLLGISVLALFASMVFSVVPTTPASAAPNGVCDNNRFLTLPPWYRGLTTGTNCEISVDSMNAQPRTDSSGKVTEKPQTAKLRVFIQVLALNIVEILMQIVAYVCVAFIIVGGFKYITSAGSPDGNSSGRQTIQNALIGLVISMISVGIINFIAGDLI